MTSVLFCTFHGQIYMLGDSQRNVVTTTLPDTPVHCTTLTTDRSEGWMQATEMLSSPHFSAPWYTSSLDSCIIVLQHTHTNATYPHVCVRQLPNTLLFREACRHRWRTATRKSKPLLRNVNFAILPTDMLEIQWQRAWTSKPKCENCMCVCLHVSVCLSVFVTGLKAPTN